ncbi:MAG: alkaline phosphatase [Bacteroidetes bacterium]|nr:alkaline phosphatase [Bacteroidota bacterium]
MKISLNIAVLILMILIVQALCFNAVAQSPGTKSSFPNPKNVIIMIGDGMGFNCVKAADYFYGPMQIESFPVKLAVATYPAKSGEFDEKDTTKLSWAAGYNPSMAWKDSLYLRKDFTESAAAATALATGRKTYNNVIGLSVTYDTLRNLCEIAKSLGKSAGVITCVPISHATPAGFVAHNKTRIHYSELATYMLFSSRCDLIMGCGNPEFDDNGKKLRGAWKDSKYVADSNLWLSLKSGSGIQTSFIIKDKIYQVTDVSGDRIPDPWTLVTSEKDFRKLMSGKTPKRVLGIPEVYSTLQQGRDFGKNETKNSPPFTTPVNPILPTLAEMVRGGLNVLDNNPKGFFVMIEGGAIDWANHDNQKGRMLEEMRSFSDAIDTVAAWVNKHSSWNETLLIITADHECGDLWGGNTYTPVADNGKNKMPGLKYNSKDHTNALVGMWVKGKGAEIYNLMAGETDPVRGRFVQNAVIPQLIFMMWGKPVTF